MITWLAERYRCLECDDIVLVTPAVKKSAELWWYCANKQCPHHDGEQIDEDDECSFVYEAQDPH
jgi:hypothetical protein